jgi:hypothetical protein
MPNSGDMTLFAWTSVGDYRYYPQFLNVSRIGGRMRFMVRTLEDASGEHPVCGPVAEMFLPDEEVPRLIAAISSLPQSDDRELVERLSRLDMRQVDAPVVIAEAKSRLLQLSRDVDLLREQRDRMRLAGTRLAEITWHGDEESRKFAEEAIAEWSTAVSSGAT